MTDDEAERFAREHPDTLFAASWRFRRAVHEFWEATGLPRFLTQIIDRWPRLPLIANILMLAIVLAAIAWDTSNRAS